ncbi:MAG: hypothetical protein KY455_11330 [Euryarchaeota archaeon]|nr:hypothetical protein [Euryarchaeota archaeon]
MNALIQLINTVSRHLKEHAVPHALVGGITVAIWGRPRATEDVDLLLDIREDDLPALKAYCDDHDLKLDLDAAKGAIKAGRSFPVYDMWSIHWIDARVPVRVHDTKTLERATLVEIGKEKVPVATPEDAILGKLITGRQQDLVDARSIVLRKETELDLEYITEKVHAYEVVPAWEKIRPQIV